MTSLKPAVLGLAMIAAAPSANATIINLSAGPTNPNAGPASYQTYVAPNYITDTLAPGTYNVSVVGLAGGGAYDAYSINTGNNTFSAGFHYQVDGSGIDNRYLTGSNYSTAAAAAIAYAAFAPLTLTLTATTTYDFYLNDGAYPYFADDSGGTSLSIVSAGTQVPEPASVAIFCAGLLGLGVARQRASMRG